PERVKVHHLCYEDLHSNPSKELKRVTDFLGIKKVDPDHYERAVKQTPAFGDKNTEYESIPRNSAYLKPELPTNEDSDGVTESEEELKEPYLREFEEEDLHWLRAQMDAFLPVEFPFYREDIN
ncbi:MAG: sulfotransferase domain-containing protein, partial [Opitutae bacterium]